MDVTDIKYPDETFDIIICNHVLEHIVDDIKAMNEFYRVLRNDGWAIIMVSQYREERTYEDFSITTKEGRLKAFGNVSHVRKYGQDFINRLRSAGFVVKPIRREEIMTKSRIKKIRAAYSTIFYCEK